MGAVGFCITISGDGGSGFLPPIVLLKPYFYTDSIGDKLVQVLDSVDTNGHQEEHQNELSVGQRAAHEIEYPFIQEFSELLSDLSTKELLKLLTNQQKNLAKAFWEAENYGGCREKCKKRLAEIHGNDWMKAVKFREHFHPIEDYYIYVLLLDHRRQWDKHKKIAMLNQANDPE